MARTTPRVDGAALVGLDDGADPIYVGTPAWYDWLETATAFAFTSQHGSFTARKERRARGGWYWKAYRSRFGRLRRVYLGKARDLTLDRLNDTAASLADPSASAPAHPVATHPAGKPAPPALTAPIALPPGTVTFLFTDIEGSTTLWESHPQAMAQALARHDAILHEVVAGYGGLVFKTVGDSVHAVFTTAPQALEAALAAQHALQHEAWGATGPLRVRMALHTGAAEARDGDYFGPPLNRIARILSAGHGGQVLLSLATKELVRDQLRPGVTLIDLGAHQLKDLSRPEQIFQIVYAGLPDSFPPLRTLAPPPTAATSHIPNLLTTKLFVPPTRANLVLRPRLTAQLQAGLQGKLTLIAAPAGFGKTTLLSAWLAHQRLEARDWRLEESSLASSPQPLASRVAWVSLDSADNDPLRFWSYVIAALDSLAPGVGAPALALLQSPQPPNIEVILTTVLNAFSACYAVPAVADVVLVLDDYHAITAAAIHRALALLLDYAPPHLHLMIATRVDPALPLARLRARGAVTELRAADLRFTPDEMVTFLNQVMGLSLTSADLALLQERTEGWIAGLQLAALALREQPDPADFIRAFTGTNRYIVDYLATEVFTRQPAHIQTFLLHTALLDRMCGPLCDAVLGLTPDERPMTNDERQADASESAVNFDRQLSSLVLRPSSDSYSQLILDQLERANLFIVPLDGERHWYRYHQLFAEVLRARLASGATSEAIAILHRRASLWFEQQGERVEAIQHALAAKDWARAIGMIEQVGLAAMLPGQARTLLGWMTRLPAAHLRAHPALQIIHASALMFANQLDAAEARLRDAERDAAGGASAERARLIEGQAAAVRGNLARFCGDIASCVVFARRALELLSATDFLHTVAHLNSAAAYLASGDVSEAAEELAAAAIPQVRASGNACTCLRSMTNLARLQALQGRLRTAAATYREAAHTAAGPGGLRVLIGSPAYYLGMGDLLREWNELDSAEQHLSQGMQIILETVAVDADDVSLGYLALARLQQARGDHSGADTTLHTFADLARQRRFAPHLVTRAAAVQAQLALAQGQLGSAGYWADTSGLGYDDQISYPREPEYLALARVRIAQARATPGAPALQPILGLLDRLLADARAKARLGSAGEILLLRALTLHTQGELDGARAALDHALELAAPEGYIRRFVDEGAPMAALLQDAGGRGNSPDYVARLLATFPTPNPDPRAESAPVNPLGS
jgi:LuxR family maltose regulon positive regulatory protein